MSEYLDADSLGNLFLRAMLLVMASSAVVSGGLAYLCWQRKGSGAIWRILGRQYTVSCLRSILILVIVLALPENTQVAEMEGHQWAWLSLEVWASVTLWELGVWLKGRD